MMMMYNVTAINALEHHDSRTTHDPSSSSPPLAAAYPSVCYNSCFLHFIALILYIAEI
jgi:hypothetical protein